MAKKVVRKQWTVEAMSGAVEHVKQECGLREAARQYSVPPETLRRSVQGIVGMNCRSGPSTVY